MSARPCVRCGRQRFIHRRGLCDACYRHREDPDYRPPGARTATGQVVVAHPTRRTEIVLEEWDWLRRYGLSVADVAPRLGLKPESLDRALHRALARGDDRGRHTCYSESEALAS